MNEPRAASSHARVFAPWLALVALALLPVSYARADNSGIVAASEDLLEWLEDAKDEYDSIQARSDELSELSAEIERAKSDPSALSGSQYADLFVRLTMILPDSVELPEPVTRAIRVGAGGIGLLIEGAVDMSLDTVRNRFNRNMQVLAGDTSMTETEKAWSAAKQAGHTRQVQQWAFLDWLRRRHAN